MSQVNLKPRTFFAVDPYIGAKTYPKPRKALKIPDDRSLTIVSCPGKCGSVDSTISGSPGIIIVAVKIPTSACPNPISTIEFGSSRYIDGPTKIKATQLMSAERIIVTRFSIKFGTYCTRILAGM